MKSCIHLKLSSLVYNVMEFKMYIFLYVDLEIFAVLIGESAENTIMQMELDIIKMHGIISSLSNTTDSNGVRLIRLPR